TTTVVVGTFVNQQPALPSSIQIGSDKVPVKWENNAQTPFNNLFDRTVIKGEADRKGIKTIVIADVWTLPENLVYLIDAGRIAPNSSQIFEATRSLYGKSLLNDTPDRKYTTGDSWGYVEREQNEDQKVYVTAGKEDDLATSFLSDGKDKDEGLTYKLTLQP
ncbi:MAG: carbohydrate-binding protein, partial [Paraprevotella sp.]|nr:carbohydrate-binding protein [Paraprevotella sp.]